MKKTANYNLKKPDGTDVVNIEDLNNNSDIVDGELKKVNDGLSKKVDKVSGKGLSTNDFDNNYKKKLDGIQAGATNYSHPSSHPAAMISEDANHRFVTDGEKTTWNSKASAHDHPYRANNWVPNWSEVTGKPSSFPPSGHNHTISQISDLDNGWIGKKPSDFALVHSHPYKASNWVPNWNEVQGKPSTFNPSSHTHDDRYYTEGEVNNLLNTKANNIDNNRKTNDKSVTGAINEISNKISGIEVKGLKIKNEETGIYYYLKLDNNGLYLQEV